jgi:tetratricopeptide (TPR) repeat protein
MAHFDRGLESIAHLPSDPSQDRRELELQLARGAVWIAYKGWASTEAGEAFTRAHVLAQQLNSRVEQLESLRGLTAHTWVRGDLRSAREQAERFIILARQIGEKVNLDTGHMLLGGVLAWQGEFSDAAKSLEQVIGRYNREDHRASIQSVNLDPGVNAMAHFGWTLCMLGFLDRASDSSEQAVMMARKLNQPFSLAQALRYSSIVCILTGQWKNFEEIRAEVEETVAKNRLGQYEPYLIHMNAVASIAKNQHALALSELQRARSSYQTSQATLFFPMVLSLQASVCGRIGRPEDGLKKLSEAIVFTDKHSMRYMDAELHRLRGELLLMRSDSHDAAEAEASFHESLDVARRQKAKSWELRAATSLARLWHDQGKAAEARDLLAPVYGWFTEGFDTADLKDAKALLDELS